MRPRRSRCSTPPASTPKWSSARCPSRTIDAGGKRWHVYPVGPRHAVRPRRVRPRLRQRHRRRARGARHALFAAGARSRERSLPSSPTRDLRAAVRHVAAELHVARSRLRAVTGPAPASAGSTPRRRPVRRSALAFDRVRRFARAGRRHPRRASRWPRRPRAHRSRHRRRHRRGAGGGRGARRACRAGVELSAVEGDAEDAHPRSPSLATRASSSRASSRFATCVARAPSASSSDSTRSACASTFAAVLEQAAGGAIGRPHVARAMIADGWAVDFRDAFDRYLGERPPGVRRQGAPRGGRRDRSHSPRRRPGGHRAPRAHRNARADRSVRRARASTASRCGIRATRRKTSRGSMALVDHFSLVPSGGSDWHGAADGPRTLGMMRVPASWLERQDGRVRVRVA